MTSKPSVKEALLSLKQNIDKNNSYISPNIKKEAALLCILLLTGFLLPSYLSLTYLTATLVLLLIFLRLERGKSIFRLKKLISMCMLAFSVITIIVELYYLIRMPYDLSGYSKSDIRYFKVIGISFNEDTTAVDTFMTFLPKVIAIIFAVQLITLYNQGAEDESHRYCKLTKVEKARMLNVAVYLICIASCIIQSIVQLCLFMACAAWMISRANNLAITKRLQYFITQFCLVFFFMSLPLTLYLEINARLSDNRIQDSGNFEDSIFFPSDTTATEYSFFCIFTVVAFVMLAVVEKSALVDEDGNTIAHEEGPDEDLQEPTAAKKSEESFSMDGDEKPQSRKNDFVPTYEPVLARILVILVILLDCFVFHSIPSLILLFFASSLLFIPICTATFNISCFVLTPLSLVYFLYFYIMNLNGLYPESWNEKYPFFLHKFKYGALEAFLLFLAFYAVCKLTSYRPFYRQGQYDMYLDELRSVYWNKNNGACTILQLFMIEGVGHFIMLSILVSACLNVTLYNVILIYLSLFYFSLRKESTAMFIIMLFWSVSFLILEYLNSHFLFGQQIPEFAEMSSWLDLPLENSFDLTQLKDFSWDKILIVLLLWTRLQIHRYLSELSPRHRETAIKLLQKKSKFLDFVINSSEVFEKILFVGTLAGMMVILLVQTVNLVNWIFLILLYTFISMRLAIKINEASPRLQRTMEIFSFIIILYCAIMIILQTGFQIMIQIQSENDVNVDEWMKANLYYLHRFSRFLGLEIVNDQEAIIIKFLSLSFFFIGSIILRKNLIQRQDENHSNPPSPGLGRITALKTGITAKGEVLDEVEFEETTGYKIAIWIAQRFYYVWSFAILALALHWRISLSMLFCLFFVVFMLSRPTTFMTNGRDPEGIIEGYFKDIIDKDTRTNTMSFKGKDDDFKQQHDLTNDFIRFYKYNELQKILKESKMLYARQNCALGVFVVVGLTIILMYPSELLWRNFDVFEDKAPIRKAIYFLNWAGIYHHWEPNMPFELIVNDNWGYLLILAIMFVEKYLQALLYEKLEKDKTEIVEDIEQEKRSKKIESTRDEIRTYIEAKSEALIYQSVRIYIMYLATFICLIAIGFMSNILGLFYIVFALCAVFKYGIEIILVVSTTMILLQYIMAVLTLSATSQPIGFPPEVIQNDSYAIPIVNLATDKNFAFNSFMFATDDAQLTGIWIDFILLLILSYYLRVYKLPFNCSNIPSIREPAIECFENDGFTKEKSAEIYEEIKKESSTSRWMIRFNYSRVLAQHIFVITAVSFLVVLNISLVSIIVLPIFLFMFSKANDRAWVQNELPRFVKITLGIMLADILVSILFQTPLFGGKEGTYERIVYWIDQIGWRIIWDRSAGPASKLEVEAYIDFCGKCSVACILLVQYTSPSDSNFINWVDDIDALYELAPEKADCKTYRFNNNKVQKVVLQQRETQQRSVLVNEIEAKVANLTLDDSQKRKIGMPLLPKAHESDHQSVPADSEAPISGNKISGGITGIAKGLFKQMEEVQESTAVIEAFVAKNTERMIEEMPYIPRKIQNLRDNSTDQILFSYSREHLELCKDKAQKGMIRIDTELEAAMRIDLMEWLRAKNDGKLKGQNPAVQSSLQDEDDDANQKSKKDDGLTEAERLNLEDPQLACMQRTQSYLKTRAGPLELLSAYLEVAVSNANNIACLLMLVAQFTNGTFLTVVYPLAVFGYILLEETRPAKWFWDAIIYYTLAFIFLRFATQFNFGFDAALEFMRDFYIGLEPMKDGWEMFRYVLTEVAIVCAATLAKLNEQLTGLGESDELDRESISDAIKRFLENSTLKARLTNAMGGTNVRESGEERKTIYSKKVRPTLQKDTMQLLSAVKEEYTEQSARKVSDMSQKKEETDKVAIPDVDIDLDHDDDAYVEKVAFLKRNYFERLFPSIIEQKPGRDYYAKIFTIQMIILIYILVFWTLMNQKTPTMDETLNTAFLSSEMVTFFMIQVILMSVDRYISNAKFTELKEQEQVRSTEHIDGNDLLKNFDISFKPDGDSLMQTEAMIHQAEALNKKIQAQKDKKKQDDEASQQPSDSEDEVEGTVNISKVKLQKAMAVKYYFLWAQLVFVHFMIFFYLPFRGNNNLHGKIFCDPNKYAHCNSFKENWALIVFYLLWCWYFWLSSLQIRYGYPEIRKANFLMGSYDGFNGDLLFFWTMIPFVMEIKILLDWTFSRTALDVFQWFKFTNFHYDLYMYRCGNFWYTKRKLGEPVGMFDKGLCGGFFLTLIFLLLVTPLYLFSDLGTALNPITSAELSFSIKIQNNNGMSSTLQLFETSLVEQIRTFHAKDFTYLNDFQLDDRTNNFLPEQIQEIRMSNYSQESWGVTPPLKQVFIDALAKEQEDKIFLEFQTIFHRNEPINAKESVLKARMQIESQEQRTMLSNMLNRKCDHPENKSEVTAPKLIFSTVMLDETAKASFIKLPGLLKDIEAQYSCQDYWVLNEIDDKGNRQGLNFFTFSEKISPSFLTEYTVFTIYTSVIFIFGQLIRMMFVVGTHRLPFQNMTYSDPLLVLCEQIIISRRQGRLEREDQLYWTLMEVARSTEMIREFTGSTLPNLRQVNIPGTEDYRNRDKQ